TTGAFSIGFARYLGASDFVLGLLAGLPAAVGLLQIPASLYSDTLVRRKRFVAFNAVAGRLVWLLIALIPFVVPPTWQIGVFVTLATVSAAFLTIIGPAWTSWMSDLVPSDSRGRYFGQRSMAMGVATMLLPLPAGAFLDLAVKHHLFPVAWGFAVLFTVACAASVASGVMLLRQPEPPRPQSVEPPPERVNPFKALSAPLADRNFRAFILYAAIIVASATFAGQFFVAWQLDKTALNLPYLTVQILGAVAAGAGLATTQLWGYLSDKFGSRPLLQLATIAAVVSPLLWLFTVPGAFALNVTIIVVLNLFAGTAWAGIGIAQFNLLLSTAPAQSRTTYVAVFSALTGVVGGVAPILGGVVMELLQSVQFSVGFLTINNFKILFFVTALLRIGAIFLLSRVREPDGRSTRYVLEQLTAARPLSSFLKLQQLARPVNEALREQAIEGLAELRSPLAVEELVSALGDVSQSVRDSAAYALGEIGDARAVPALSANLSDPVAGIGTIAAAALGRIGDVSAVPALVAAAQGEDAEVRVASLKALAQIAAPESLPVVVASLTTRHPTTCEAACAALSALAPRLPPEENRAAAQTLAVLLAPDVPRGIRFAAARALRDVAKTGASPEIALSVMARLSVETDGAVASRLAFALSRFGGDGADSAATLHESRTAAILSVLDRAESYGLAHKQTLAAVAEMGLD
ncbi:MAG: MFS transporter, partial [Armatimonadetes bacterium]|nr:MFS transporter [Armatimonadota bacterium]